MPGRADPVRKPGILLGNHEGKRTVLRILRLVVVQCNPLITVIEGFKPMIAEVEYTLAPIQKEAVWDGGLQAESMWCYADKDSYQKAIGNVYENYPKYKKMATELKDWVRKEFEAEKQHHAFANAVSPSGEALEEQKVVNFD